MLHEMYDGLMIMDFFDDCIIGVIKGIGAEDKVCYSYSQVIAKLMREDEIVAEDDKNIKMGLTKKCMSCHKSNCGCKDTQTYRGY